MKKRSKPRIPLLSRKVKTLILAAIAIFLLFAVITGDFPLTAEVAFRLSEKASLLEPGKILGTESIGTLDESAFIVAENDNICMTYVYNKWDWNNPDSFVYMKKAGDLTFTSVSRFHKYGRFSNYYDIPTLIILFDDYPDAARAELNLKPCITKQDGIEEAQWNLTSRRESDGYFLFNLDRKNDQYFLIHCLEGSLTDTIPSSNFSVPAVIRLYDKDNQLILEREMDLDEQY